MIGPTATRATLDAIGLLQTTLAQGGVELNGRVVGTFFRRESDGRIGTVGGRITNSSRERIGKQSAVRRGEAAGFEILQVARRFQVKLFCGPQLEQIARHQEATP